MSILKKISLPLAVLTLVIAPISIIVSSKIATKQNLKKKIVGVGSSSVHPLIKAFNEMTDYSIQYVANGSGAGKESQSKNELIESFGMTSSPKYPLQDEIKNWKNNKIRTITWAIDAIAIVLKIPHGLIITDDKRPEVDIKELSKLYDDDLKTNTTWRELLINESNKSTTSVLSAIPRALGRQGGKAASGTSDGFWHTLAKNMAPNSKPDTNHLKLSKKNLTPESNAQSLNILNSSIGGVTYISLGYAIQNESSSLKLAIIKKSDSEKWNPSIEEVKKGGYKWIRPFNVIYSVKNKTSIEFVWNLLSPKFQKIISNKNFISLTKDQIIKQIPIDNSDEEMEADFKSQTKFGLDF